MQVKVTVTGRRVEPFGDAPGAVLIHNRPLSQWRIEALEALDLEVTDAPSGPHLEIPDTLFTTAGALRRFIDAAAGGNAVLVLKDSFFAKYTTPVQADVVKTEEGWRFEKVRFHSGEEGPYRDVVVDPEEKQVSLPMPKYYLGVDKMEMGFPRLPFLTIHHWVHILWANQVAMAIEGLAVPKWRWAVKIAWAILRARSLNKWRVMGKMNTVGKNCDIHPTALVEMSNIGEGVEIGPYARVRFSRLGDNVKIMAGAQVEFSVVGDKVWLGQECCLNHCVAYPEAIANQRIMQLCVLGNRVVTTDGSWSMDLNFEKEIRVTMDGKLYNTGQRTLGSAFGHNARVGCGVWLASGRSVPNDTFMIRDPRKIISKLPAGLSTTEPLTVDDGIAVSVTEKLR